MHAARVEVSIVPDFLALSLFVRAGDHREVISRWSASTVRAGPTYWISRCETSGAALFAHTRGEARCYAVFGAERVVKVLAPSPASPALSESAGSYATSTRSDPLILPGTSFKLHVSVARSHAVIVASDVYLEDLARTAVALSSTLSNDGERCK